MKEDFLPTTAVFDPVALNIGNMVQVNTVVHNANITSSQGWMIRGEFNGELTIQDGTLWIDQDAKITGRINVKGSVYVFGQIGQNDGDSETRLICHGTLHLTSTAVVYGHLSYRKISMYDGARVSSRLDNLSAHE